MTRTTTSANRPSHDTSSLTTSVALLAAVQPRGLPRRAQKHPEDPESPPPPTAGRGPTQMAAPAPLRRERAADLTLVADILGLAAVRTARRHSAAAQGRPRRPAADTPDRDVPGTP